GAAAPGERNDVHRVEQRVDGVRDHTASERRGVQAVHDDEQLVERHAAAAEEAAGKGLVDDPREPWRRLGGAARELALTPRARLEDEVARPLEGRLGQLVVPAVQGAPPPTDRVDLVDEHDALAAPLAGEPLRLPR